MVFLTEFLSLYYVLNIRSDQFANAILHSNNSIELPKNLWNILVLLFRTVNYLNMNEIFYPLQIVYGNVNVGINYALYAL